MPTTCIDSGVLAAFTGVGSFLGLVIGGVIGYCARYGDYSVGYADGYTQCFEEAKDYYASEGLLCREVNACASFGGRIDDTPQSGTLGDGADSARSRE